jgi:hypothetical protein
MTEVYVVCRRVDDRNLIAGVYRDRANAIENAEGSIQKVTHGRYESYSVDCRNASNTDISVFEGDDWQSIVFPFELR